MRWHGNRGKLDSLFDWIEGGTDPRVKVICLGMPNEADLRPRDEQWLEGLVEQ